MIVAIGAPKNDNNSSYSGYTCIFFHQNIILAKEIGYYINKYENRLMRERIILNTNAFSPTLEKQLACREMYIEYLKQNSNNYYACEAIWG